MPEILTTLLGSILSGGATGLIGVALQRFADYKNKQLDIQFARQKFEQDVALKNLDMQMMEKEWAGRVQVAQTEAEAAADAAASKAFEASYGMEPKRYSEGVTTGKFGGLLLILLDVFRGIVRPALTVYLCVLSTLIYLQARELVNKEELSSDQAMGLENLIVATMLYLTTTCVLWWFGTRNKQQVPEVQSPGPAAARVP